VHVAIDKPVTLFHSTYSFGLQTAAMAALVLSGAPACRQQEAPIDQAAYCGSAKPIALSISSVRLTAGRVIMRS
jgi:hypothetical protein